MVSRVDSPDAAPAAPGDLYAAAAARAARLERHTSLAVGGAPEFLFEPTTEVEAAAIVRRLARDGVPWRVLGGGFNLLVRERVVRGAVLATRRLLGWDEQQDVVWVGAGVPFPSVVKRAPALGIPGISGCPGIPGCVGGIVAMNAGGRFGSVVDGLHAVRYVDPEGHRRLRVIRPGDMRYRDTRFLGCVVTAAGFRREPTLDAAEARALYNEALTWKKATQPLGARSAGCIFKNPADGRSAGQLIDAAGCKGWREGSARVSPIHANFIETLGDGDANDVLRLIERVRAHVRDHAGVTLELEVEVW